MRRQMCGRSLRYSKRSTGLGVRPLASWGPVCTLATEWVISKAERGLWWVRQVAHSLNARSRPPLGRSRDHVWEGWDVPRLVFVASVLWGCTFPEGGPQLNRR